MRSSSLLVGMFVFVLLCSSSVFSVDAASMWNKTYGGAAEDVGTRVVQTSDGGYAIAAYTSSFGTGGVGIQPWLIKTDAAGNMQWNKTYGGEGGIAPWGMCQTADGGYALAGSTTGLENTDFWAVGVSDYWLTKTDSTGNVQWVQTYGGTKDDYGQSMVQTNDGGYALTGYTDSFGAGSTDFYLVKTDASGNLQWNRTYGHQWSDYGQSVIQTSDGGYALTGSTIGIENNTDFWLVKTDAVGNMHWNKTYGGAGNDQAVNVIQTVDGGYALGGWTDSFGAGGNDFWLVKTDAAGNMLWNKTYGGPEEELQFSMIQTEDGGYAMTGSTLSFDAGQGDFWLVKTDTFGTMQWSKTYGGERGEPAYSVIQTIDRGYALAGSTASFEAGNYDVWLVKVDESGVALLLLPPSTPDWSKTCGGNGNDIGYSMVQTPDGGYAVAGTTSSYGAGRQDAWLFKTDASGNLLWEKTFGGAGDDAAYSVVQTTDGGYAVAGSFGSGGDMWLIRTDANGNLLWEKTYLNPYNSYYLHDAGSAKSLFQTSDGGFVMVGDIYLGGSSFDVWLVKTDSNGNMQWNKAYSEVAAEVGRFVVQTTDGGYAIAGEDLNHMYLIKTNATGDLQWNGIFGEGSWNNVGSLVQSVDGGYAMVGTTHSYVSGTRVILVKTDGGGNLQWSRTYDEANDFLTSGGSVAQTSDQGYALAATIWNGADGYDVWIAKVDPNGNMNWSQTYGGTGAEISYDLVQTSDGGYAFTGSIGPSFAGVSDIWLVKVGEPGVIPEGLTIGVILTLSTVAVIVSSRYSRRKPKNENSSRV